MSTADPPNLNDYLPHFGLKSFRPGQLEVMQTLLGGRDCLVVMPTGGGKSLCYQLPALASEGVTLVISPLIALMKDQVDALQSLGIRATLINSTIAPSEQQYRLQQMVEGELDMLYVVPERFRSNQFREAASQANIGLMAIDEAHCISEWGHDFRPDYARLGYYRKQIGNPTTIALTATATKQVRDDIVKQLDLTETEIFITGFERENLHYKVVFAATRKQKNNALTGLINRTKGTGIVYAATRARCEEVAQMITDLTDRRTAVYHGGMAMDDRKRAQEAFMSGEVEVIVATNAFGMGIDKADVRFVAHYNFPSTIEAYYQEAGRAGRDGLPATCLLLYSAADRRIQEYFIDTAYPSREAIKAVYEFLCEQEEDPIEVTQEQLRELVSIDISTDGVGNCEQLLEKSGAIRRLESFQNMAVVQINSDLPTLVDLLPKNAKTQRKVLRAIENMIGSRRHEPVYFQRYELDRQLDMDQTAVSRALKEIVTLQTVDYIPPFRGRAIHLLNKEIPFEKLDIDFKSLEARRKADYDKLDAVTQYAFSDRCRQLIILHYFGEESADENCGHCDRCDTKAAATSTDQQEHSATDDTRDPELLQAIRIALSGVARAGNKYGRRLLAQMLCGSKSQSITKCRLDKLSTYGLLSKLTQDEAVELLDGLISIGCLQQKLNDSQRPIVHLCEYGKSVMRDENALKTLPTLGQDLLYKLNSNSGSNFIINDDTPQIDQSNHKLYQDLSDWRLSVAEEQAIPAYHIFNNDTLQRIASSQPQNVDELLAIKGMGEKRIARFGSTLLAIVQKHSSQDAPQPNQKIEPQSDVVQEKNGGDSSITTIEEDQETQNQAALKPDADVDDGRPRSSAYWTWRCFKAGFSLADCMQIRNLTDQQLIGHLQRAVEEELIVEPTWFLSQQELRAIEQQIQVRVTEKNSADHSEQIRPLLAKLPESIRFEQVQLFLKCRAKNATYQ